MTGSSGLRVNQSDDGDTGSQKLKMSRRFCLLPLDDETVIARTGAMSLRLRGKDVGRIAEWLRVRLNGQHTFEDLIRQADEFSSEEIAALLATMLQHGIVENAGDASSSSLSEPEMRRYEAEQTFFSHFSQNPSAYLDALKQAHIVIVGAGAVGARAALCLALAGVGRITAVDEALVTQELAAASDFYSQVEVGRLRSETVADRLRQVNPFVTARSSATPLRCADDVRANAADASLLLLCQEEPAASILEWTNEACLEQNLAWTSARIEDFLGIVGPSVVPFQTACYKCYDLRRKSNLDAEDFEETLAWEKLINRKGALDFSTGLLPPFATLLGSAAAIEALKIVTGFEKPTAFNAVWEIDFLTLKATVRPLLRLPRCPACGNKRPALSPWNET